MEQVVIYAAGNPDFYPVEYYDSKEGVYRGMIPELLRQFSENTDYQVSYYMPGEEDLREVLARDRQVDIISGCVGDEHFRHKSDGEVLVMEAWRADGPVSYRLLLTDAAPQGLKEELEDFLAAADQEEKLGMLIDISQGKPGLYRRKTGQAFAGLGVIILTLGIGVAWLSGRCRRYRKAADKRDETDGLTGIGNREYLIRNYERFVVQENRTLYVVIYFHVDTDTMRRALDGEKTDELLRLTASFLLKQAGSRDIVARVSGSGFVMVRMCPGDEESKEWVLSAMSRIQEFSGNRGRYFGAGLLRLKEGDWDVQEVLLTVGQAARSAYREGLDYKICTDGWIRALREDGKLQADVKRGLENREFQMYVQFYADAETGRITGGEALARWGHPEKGFLPPDRFIPLMEREGLMSRLDYYSLDQACGFLERLHQVGLEDFFMSCNFSSETLKDGNFADQCMEIIQTYQFDRKRLIFQITEKAVKEAASIVLEHIRKVKGMGVRIALDDFGEGFTAFADIGQYQPDVLQLDKNLVDLLGTRIGNAIVKAMAQAGHELGIGVMAEGAEEEGQVRLLRELGCDVIQGFYFYRPIPSWEAAKKLLDQSMDLRKGGV